MPFVKKTELGPSPDELRFKLAEQEEKLTGLRNLSEDAAFALQSGAPGAEQEYHDIALKVQAAEQLVESIRRAIPASERRVQADRAKALQAVHASKLAALRQQLTAREKAAQKLQDGLVAAVAAWKEVCRLNEAAKNAAPLTPAYPLTAGLAGADHIHQLIAAEIYRLAADPSRLTQPNIFPGAKTTIHYVNQPGSLPPLVDAVRTANEHIMSVMRGERQVETRSIDEQIFPADMIRSGTLPSTAEQPAIAGEGEPKYVAGHPDQTAEAPTNIDFMS